MIAGIGIDSVDIEEFRDICGNFDNAFVKRTFAASEIDQAIQRPDAASFLAGRFAVKEAVFKAVAHLLPEGAFDFRCVETLHDENGCPAITKNNALANVLENAHVDELLVSITNEANLATAIVVAQAADN